MKKLAIGLLIGASTITLVGCAKYPGVGGNQDKIGVWGPYGCDPQGSVGECLEAEPGEKLPSFKPKYVAVVYMKFNQKAAGFTARHAYFKYDNDASNNQNNLLCAIDRLRKNGRGNACRFYKPVSGGPQVYVRDNFENFNFGSQQEIYVIIDNENIQFNEKIPMNFTPYGAYDYPYPTTPTKHDNKSIFDAKVIKIKEKRKITQALYYKNYFLDDDGTLINSKNRKYTEYSINFNLLVCKNKLQQQQQQQQQQGANCAFDDPSQVIPIAIDPDTGNGWGNEP